MKTRKVKLYRKYRVDRFVPELRLSGDWLSAAGFKMDKRVVIEVSENQLILKIIE